MQRVDQKITDRNGVLISETIQLNPVRILWMFDNGGEISLMKKPELVIIAKGRLVELLAEQCEGMDETALRKRLSSLVRTYIICLPCLC